MPADLVEYVDGEKFPRDVRTSVNSQAAMWNGTWEVKEADNFATAPNFFLTEGRVVLVLPPGSFNRAQYHCPYFVTPSPKPANVRVSLLSYLLNTIDVTSLCSITGLNVDLSVSLADKQMIWMKIDTTPLNNMPPGIPTANFGSGTTWNAGKNFWPAPVEFDTDDGTPNGSSGTPPTNRKQIAIFVPLAKIKSVTGPADGPPGAMIGMNLKLIQLANTHFRIAQDCYKGNIVWLANPWTGGIET